MVLGQVSFYGRCGAVAGAIALLASCGGGGGGGNNDGGFFFPPVAPAVVVEKHVIGGTVTGLVGSLVLQNNAGDDLTLTADGKFSFATSIATGSAYAVSVRSQPYWQFCTVTKGSGTVTADVGDVAVTCAQAAAQVSKLTGSGASGSANGNSDTASFADPFGILIDKNGELIVSEVAGNRVRKITASGDVTTFAGNGGAADTVNGNGTAASFNGLTAIGLAPSGDLYAAEFIGNVIRKITPTADVSEFAGQKATPGTVDANGAAARFTGPIAMTIDGAGTIFLAELNTALIRKITPAGDVVTLAGSGPGFANGVGGAAKFRLPYGIAVDAAGNLFVADSENNLIRQVAPNGEVTTFAGNGTAGAQDGPGDSATFLRPGGLAFDALGNLYVADTGNSLLRKITPARVVSTVAGKALEMGKQNGIGNAARFSQPYGLTIGADGTIYVADTLNNQIRKVVPVAAP
jgi:streptogramin lyase